MGYDTKFEGCFELSKLPSAEAIVRFNEIDGQRADEITNSEGAPESYCQWELAKDCRRIKWDGNEKFYDYEEWLQWIYDTILKPEGIELTGVVKYRGDDWSDTGTLSVEGGKVVKRKLSAVGDELAELIRFRDFVLASDYSEEIVTMWRRSNGK